MHWLPERSRLDRDQNDACDACISTVLNSRPGAQQCWVQGSAGTGKSVVLVHALRETRRRKPGLSMVFVTYTHALKALVLDGLDDETKAAIPVMTAHEFIRERRRCDVLFVDEIQDLDARMIEALRGLSGVMVVGGDPVQSIYYGATPEEIGRIVVARPLVLDVMYRLTRNLLVLAGSIHPAARLQDAKLARLKNVDVLMGEAESEDEEAAWVWKQARDGAELGTPSAILLPNHKEVQRFAGKIAEIEGLSSLKRTLRVKERYDYQPMNAAFASGAAPLRYLGNSYGDLAESNRRKLVYLMTYHSAKGLDFERVYVPRLSPKLRIPAGGDPEQARRLLFVAVTRAREELVLSRAGAEVHPLVAQIPEKLFTRIRIKPMDAEEVDDDLLF